MGATLRRCGRPKVGTGREITIGVNECSSETRYNSVFVFFSSRRRHTRYWRDWSSDVCSSDLWDLGRPERFYNMLRIVKLRSPMSNQSWALIIFGQLSGLIAAKQAAEDGLLGRNFLSRLLIRFIPARLLTVIGLPFALFIGANTGILISATSVPIWARNWLLNGPTFLSSGISTALSFLSFVLHVGRWGEERTLHVLRRAERVVILIEGALVADRKSVV